MCQRLVESSLLTRLSCSVRCQRSRPLRGRPTSNHFQHRRGTNPPVRPDQCPDGKLLILYACSSMGGPGRIRSSLALQLTDDPISNTQMPRLVLVKVVTDPCDFLTLIHIRDAYDLKYPVVLMLPRVARNRCLRKY